jgi:hypothetical protein
MNKTQLKRLDKMIAHLEEVERRDPASFALENWVEGDTEENLEEAITTWRKRWKKGETLNCGTSACVVGHLPLVFPQHFEWSDSQDRDDEDTSVTTVRTKATAKHKSLEFTKHSWWQSEGLDATEELAGFFGGEDSDWDDIIYVGGYDSDDKDANGKVKLSAVLNKMRILRNQLAAEIKA